MSEETQNSTNSGSNTPAGAEGSNKTVKYVLIGLAILVVLGYGAKYVMGMFAMSAINAQLSSEGVKVSGNPINGGSYSITDKQGNTVNVDTSNAGSYVATDNKGNTVTVGANAKLPDNFPSQVPVYAGATIVTSTTANADGKNAYSVSMTSKDSYDKVSEYYKKTLAENGWKILQSMNMSSMYTMYSAENGTVVATVMVQGDEKGGDTSIAITTGEK